MILEDALQTIADRYDLDADKLLAYAEEDDIGGYHSDASQEQWPMGSLWAVEGKVLYALIRATRPSSVLELGTYAGCSTAHIEAALKKNRKGSLTTVDDGRDGATVTAGTGKRVELVNEDAIAYLKKTRTSYDLIIEDLAHERDQVAEAWTYGPKRLAEGGWMVSHDAMHFIVGQQVREGIETTGIDDALYLLVEPADCGWAVWRHD